MPGRRHTWDWTDKGAPPSITGKWYVDHNSTTPSTTSTDVKHGLPTQEEYLQLFQLL